jgi:protein required for attachment to host cells
MTIIPAKALIVVADGRKAIVLRNTAPTGAVTLHEETRLDPKNLAGEGPSGARPNEQTPHQTDEATFAKQLAHKLFAMHEAGDYQALVLAADPQTLGQMRPVLHKTVEAALVLTLNKDLTNHTTAEIAAAVNHAA